MDHDWNNAQVEEAEWWGSCLNTLGEELKQLVYARLMGLQFDHINGIPYQINLEGKSVLDVGGGPVSLLLKAYNRGANCAVVDPCSYPSWVEERYIEAGIRLKRLPGEELASEKRYDEVWLYNCLQHTQNPGLIIKNCLNAVKDGGIFRIFEWIHTPTNEAHPVSLTEEDFHEWIGAEVGHIGVLNESGCVGMAYYAQIGVKYD